MENGNYYIIVGGRGEIWVMEKKMETTMLHQGLASRLGFPAPIPSRIMHICRWALPVEGGLRDSQELVMSRLLRQY